MPTYRVEEASTGRAGCKNKECQDKKEKIAKGELRLGTWVESEQFQSWAWKHWGCVTPKQISSLQEIIGDEKDLSLLDGFDEISSENQQKVRNAAEQRHVDDEDWKGDVEMNRPGKIGFRVRTPKKKAGADSDEKKAKSDDTKKPKTQRGKKRAAEPEPEPEPEEKEKPAAKKQKSTLKKKGAAEAKPEPEASKEEPAAEKESAEKPKSSRKSTSKAKKPAAEPETAKKSKASRKAPEKDQPKSTRVTRSKAKSG